MLTPPPDCVPVCIMVLKLGQIKYESEIEQSYNIQGTSWHTHVPERTQLVDCGLQTVD